MKPTSIKVGDEFIKSEVPNTVWVVKQLVEFPGLVPHAELISQGFNRRTITLSLNALADQNLYRRIEKT